MISCLRAERGFTLIELLVVIAIITILAALLLPTLESGLEAARKVSCLSNIKQIHYGATGYADSFNGALPWFPARDSGLVTMDNKCVRYTTAQECYINGEYVSPFTGQTGWKAFLACGFATEQQCSCPSASAPAVLGITYTTAGIHYSYRYNSLRTIMYSGQTDDSGNALFTGYGSSQSWNNMEKFLTKPFENPKRIKACLFSDYSGDAAYYSHRTGMNAISHAGNARYFMSAPLANAYQLTKFTLIDALLAK